MQKRAGSQGGPVRLTARVARIALLVALSLPACRAAPPRGVVSARVSLARVRALAREGGAEFAVDGALAEQGAVAIDAGRLAILDYDQARIVELDTTGRIIRTFGRHGGGPGEIEEPRFLVRTPAGLGVVDDQKYALVQFTLDGARAPELPLNSLVGVPTGILIGLAPLADGSWLFTVREKREGSWREALYRRAGGRTRELAATPTADLRPVQLPCGISLSGEPPVFWPTLRWSARPMEATFAATAGDRITRWDAARDDSTVIASPSAPAKATSEAALALLPRTTVRLGNNGCELTPAEALRQRGMTPTRPVVERLLLSPAGELWVRSRGTDGAVFTRIISGASVDTLGGDPFPELFLSADRFVATGRDSAGDAALELWELHRAP